MFFHGTGHRDRFCELFDTPAAKVLIPHGDEGLLARLADDGGDCRTKYGLGDGPVILFFGGLRPSKGLHDLLEAFGQVHDRIPDAALLVAGNPAGGFDTVELSDTQADGMGLGDVRVRRRPVPGSRRGRPPGEDRHGGGAPLPLRYRQRRPPGGICIRSTSRRHGRRQPRRGRRPRRDRLRGTSG